MTTAELIVRALDLAAGHYPDEADLDSEHLAYADEIKRRYSKYKRRLDFSTAARLARVEVVQEILDAAAPAQPVTT